jgi:hypothetical protein
VLQERATTVPPNVWPAGIALGSRGRRIRRLGSRSTTADLNMLALDSSHAGVIRSQGATGRHPGVISTGDQLGRRVGAAHLRDSGAVERSCSSVILARSAAPRFPSNSWRGEWSRAQTSGSSAGRPESWTNRLQGGGHLAGALGPGRPLTPAPGRPLGIRRAPQPRQQRWLVPDPPRRSPAGWRGGPSHAATTSRVNRRTCRLVCSAASFAPWPSAPCTGMRAGI